MLSVKKFIREISPQLILKIARKFVEPKLSRVRFKSYEHALSQCDKTGYENFELVEEVIEKNVRFRRNLKVNAELDIETFKTLIPLAIIPRKNSLTVLDFGGGGGFHYTVARFVLDSDVQLNWAVVETKAMTQRASELEEENCKFFDEISDASDYFEDFDLVFTSGALQSCPDPLESLQQLVSLGAKYFFLTRTPTIESDEELIAIQFSPLRSNGPGELTGKYKNKWMKFPITYVSRRKVEEILSKDYEIRFKLNEGDLGFKFKGQQILNLGYFCVRKSTIDEF